MQCPLLTENSAGENKTHHWLTKKVQKLAITQQQIYEMEQI